MASKSQRQKPCRCGATTPEEHTQAILNGYKVHTYSGPKKPR